MQRKRIRWALLVALAVSALTACGGATPAGGDSTTGPAAAPVATDAAPSKGPGY